jgi:hypothetical protein
MKKLMILSFALVTSSALSAQSSWSLGIGTNSFANYSTFSGGMTDASALFHHNEHASGSFNFTARKTLHPHWSFQTGLGFSAIGFNFALAQDYSMLNRSGQWASTGVSISTTSIPASIIYNTKLNCRNWRWFVGGGFSVLFSSGSKEVNSKAYFPDDNSTVVLEQNFTASSFATINGHLISGVEKVFKRQSILSFGLILNGGANNLITTNVNYIANGKSYNHTFTNRGNYFGCYISYHFRPIGSRRAAVK